MKPLPCPDCGHDLRTHRGACRRCAIHGSTVTTHRLRQRRYYQDRWLGLYALLVGFLGLLERREWL